MCIVPQTLKVNGTSPSSPNSDFTSGGEKIKQNMEPVTTKKTEPKMYLQLERQEDKIKT